MRTVTILAALAVVLAAMTTCQAGPMPGDVLVMRYAWAPIFCSAGSANGVPKQFCGEGPPPVLQRFPTHRAGRISYQADIGDPVNCTQLTTVPEYNGSDISFAVRSALECESNSYTIGNNDEYWQSLWNDAGKCVADKTGLSPKKYFWLLTNTFKRYDVDAALRNANYDMAKRTDVNATLVLDILQDAFGYRGSFTCDSGTRSKWSTVNFCLDAMPPYRMTHCPSKMLEPPSKCNITLLTDLSRAVPVSVLF
jgi:hypothetical protein